MMIGHRGAGLCGVIERNLPPEIIACNISFGLSLSFSRRYFVDLIRQSISTQCVGAPQG
jgi:hypothetical protein